MQWLDSKLFVFFLQGKGDNYRLGFPCEEHVRFPKLVDSLLGKRILHVSVGLSNAVVITEDKQMIAWGSNQYGEFGSNNASILSSPTVVAKLDNLEGNVAAGICLGKKIAYKICIFFSLLNIWFGQQHIILKFFDFL